MKNKKDYIVPLIVVIAISLVLLIASLWFSGGLGDILEKTNDTYLTEVSNAYRSTFEAKIEDRFTLLEFIGKNFSDIDFDDYNAVKNNINATNSINDFKIISIVTMTGTTMNNNNTSSGNVSNKQWFKEASTGLSNISYDEDANGNKALIFAIPVYKGQTIKGVVTATIDNESVNDIFAQKIFNQNGASIVINSNGDIIVLPSSEGYILSNKNFYETLTRAENVNISIERLKNNMSNKYTGVLKYTLGTESYKAVYTSIGVNDWYLISVVSDNIRILNSNQMIFYAALFISIVVALFVITFIYIFILNGKGVNMKVKRDEMAEKYNNMSEVDNQVQCVVFDYSFVDSRVDYSGNIDSIIFSMTNDHYLDNIDEFLETVHFDDVSVVEDFIKNLYDAKKHKACEFRLKCKGQVYSWFRLEASTICDSEGRPIRLAGTFTNVEKRKIYETEQKLQEEKDTLTGVLKKQVFEESVTSILKKTNHEQTFGIYLIDLDNFKEINDRMGHEFGDRILVETARKISVVFSDRDYIGRLGGDDFIAFLNLAPYTSKEDAMQIIKNKGENICRILKNAYTVKGGEHSISASVGISVYKTDGESYDELFKKAKTALLTAKKNGKDKYFIYNKDICGGEY